MPKLRSPDLYPLGELIFGAGLRALKLTMIPIGHEQIPREGPSILASNHVGYLDFAFVDLAMPRPRRRVRFVARREIFHHPIAGPLMRGLRQIEADPYGDTQHALQQALNHLAAGEIVGIHPEGTISPSFVPRPAKTGAVRLAFESGAPLQPVAVWGSQRLLTKWRPRNLQRGLDVMVIYGSPYFPETTDPKLETEHLMARINELLTEAQGRYPQRPSGHDDRWWLPAHLGGTAPTPAEAEARIEQQHEERQAERQAERDAERDSGRESGAA